MNVLSQIIVFPRGQLSAKDKERLTKAGVIAIEADDPSAVRMLMPEAPLIGSNSMLMAALEAISGSEGSYAVRSAFVRALFERMKKAEDPTP